MTYTRQDLGNGRYRYASDDRGVLIESGKVFYTHAAEHAVHDYDVKTLSFHKSAAAAQKSRYPGESGHTVHEITGTDGSR